MRPRIILAMAVLPLVMFAQARRNAPPQTPGTQSEAEVRAEYIRSHYTKAEYRIPMRDGVTLFTAVYTPKDHSQKYPILLMRTPYTVGPYGVDNYPRRLGPASEKFMREGFIFVNQDVRGKGRSEGKYMDVRPVNPNKRGPKDVDEPSDTYDTIDWLVKNIPNNNERVGMYGISYPGFYAAMGAIGAHPALKATSPQAPVINWFIGDDFHHNGVLFLAHAFNFFSGFGRTHPPDGPNLDRVEMKTPDSYDFHLRTGALANYDEKYFHGQTEFWKDLIQNDTYNDFWKSRDLRQYVKNLKPAMLCVGGWFDAEDVFGPINLYKSAEEQNPGAKNMLVEGPWSHGGWARQDGTSLGNINFASNTSKFFQDDIEYPFFLYYLKSKGDGDKLPEAYVFETGRNEWHKFDAWPPKDAKWKTLYFRAGGKLAETQPAEKAESYDEYVSDPAKPVPFTPYITNGMSYPYMTDDQRFAASRTDVLVYETDPLEKDVRVAGPLKASLFVSTTGTDSDWVVKLIDVFPNDTADPQPNPANVHMGGYQMLVRGEPFRGKFRKGFDNPQPFTPGKMDEVSFQMPDVFHTFRAGHRIMVQVQSSWYPLGDRNPQKFMHIQDAKAEDFVKATQRVFRSNAAPSAIVLSTIE